MSATTPEQIARTLCVRIGHPTETWTQPDDCRCKQVAAAIRAARTEGRDHMIGIIKRLADEANTCRQCGDWYYTPDYRIPTGCVYCKPTRDLLRAAP